MSYSVILPAPGTLINSAGVADANGLPAPGFSGLNIESNYDVDVLRSRSNRGLPVDSGQHFWSFRISYHPMTVNSFTALENFMYGHNTRKNPFYVVLPNYARPKPAETATFLDTNTVSTVGIHYTNESQVIVNTVLNLQPGAYVNFLGDALHKSTYKIARVETPTSFSGTAPAAGTMRLTIFPPLQREVANASALRLINPQFRVLQRGNINPQYDENNMISFGINVEEILP